jgi:hypothetical protein
MTAQGLPKRAREQFMRLPGLLATADKAMSRAPSELQAVAAIGSGGCMPATVCQHASAHYRMSRCCVRAGLG